MVSLWTKLLAGVQWALLAVLAICGLGWADFASLRLIVAPLVAFALVSMMVGHAYVRRLREE